jgi:hypothetical protein
MDGADVGRIEPKCRRCSELAPRTRHRKDRDMAYQDPWVRPDVGRNRLDFRVGEIRSHLIETFEWNAKRWRVRFQSWPRRPQEGEPILDLMEVYPEDHPGYAQAICPITGTATLETKIAQMESGRIRRAAIKQDGTGWHLKRVSYGAEGWFDPAKLPKESSDKKPFICFDLEQGGTVYRCQFHLWEEPWPSAKPVAWQPTKGPSAGLPSLGTKR